MPEENVANEAQIPSPEEIAGMPEALENATTEETPETASTELSHDRELGCQNCGAPLDYVEGENVITCPYCGSTTMLAGYDNIVKIEGHSMLPMEVNENDAISTLITWLSKGFFRSKSFVATAKLAEAKGLMLPYWIVKSNANTLWRGKKKKSKTTGTGDNKRTQTWWEPVSGSFAEDFTWPEYARENTDEFWGIGNIQPGKKSIFPDWGKFLLRFGGSKTSPNRNMLDGQVPFDIEAVKNADMAEHLVNGQITQERAEANARGNIKTHHAKKAESKADVLSDVDTTVNVNKVDLLYVPIWEMKYSIDGKEYRALVDGAKKEVLTAEFPVSKKAKITIFDIFFGIPAIVFGIWGFSANGPDFAKYILFGLVAAMLAYSLMKGLGSKN